MKHMAIMGLMLAFALPAATAETESQQERQARELEISLRHALNDWSNIADLGRIFYRDEDDEIIAYPAVTRQEWERKYEQARRQRQEAAEREWQERQARELAQRQAQAIQEIKEHKREQERQALEWFFERHYKHGLLFSISGTNLERVGPATRPEFDRRQEAAERRRLEQEREKARAAALPPEGRLASELCREADAVMAMVVDVARYDTSRYASDYPAAPAETALKLSRLARNLRQEAKLWGFPYAPPSHSPPNGPVQAP